MGWNGMGWDGMDGDGGWMGFGMEQGISSMYC